MSLRFSNLGGIGNRINVPLQLDERGYLGRECPEESCEGYFLIKPGTGLRGESLPCHCPYCGYTGPSTRFYTKEQIAYARSVAKRQIVEAIRKDLKQFEFDLPARGPLGIGISMKLKPGTPVPIRHYREKTLETFVSCATCALDYAVYGVFGYCPDCGAHNSVQILERNLDLTRRQLALAESLDDPDLRRHLIEDALENCVSAFDGFGREVVRVKNQAMGIGAAPSASFQNLEKAAGYLQRQFAVGLSAACGDDDWEAARRGFAKRHVIAHRAGVVDDEYVRQSGDVDASVGRRIPLEAAEVRRVSDAVLGLARALASLLAT